MKIIATTSLLSPTRLCWFEELAKYAEVTVVHLYASDEERNDSWFRKSTNPNLKTVLAKGRKFGKLGIVSRDFINMVKKGSYDIIILDGYSYFTQLMNMRFLNRRKLKYFINIDGRVDCEAGRGFKARFKQKLLSAAPYFLCGSLSGKRYLINCGVSEDRIFNHVFTSLYGTDIYDTVADPAEKKTLREKLGMVEPQVVVTVGRFTYLNGYGKGYDAVMRAAERSDRKIGWYIIGGAPTAEFAAMKEKAGLDNVHFVDFKSQEELKEYYRAADLSVLMTVGDVWGLVVNEAMACGLPVITTDRCVAGRELIENGKNGFIIPVGDDEALAKHVGEIIGDSGKLEAMGKESLARIRDCTFENWGKANIEVFRKITGEKQV